MHLIHRDESGVAMPAVVMVLLIMSLLSALTVQVANHSLDVSARNRDREAALHASEAGINEALRQLAGVSGATWCGVAASESTKLPGGGGAPGQQYSVTVSDSGGVMGTCSPSDPVRLIRSTGYTPSAASTAKVSRMMEAQARMTPDTATTVGGFSFNDAIFGGSSVAQLKLDNSVKLAGSGAGNDAHVYSNHDLVLVNSTEVKGNVIAQGNISLGNSITVYGDVHAKGDILLDNSAIVYGNVISATGSVRLRNSVKVYGYTKAATTITSGSGTSIAGGRYPNSPSQPPARKDLPTFTFNASDPAWPQPVTTHASCADLQSYIVANKDAFKGTHRLAVDCEVRIREIEIKLSGPAAIVTDGWLRMDNSVKWTQGSSSNHQLWLISEHRATDAADAKGIHLGNSVEFENTPTFLFARNRVTKVNSTKHMGQVYADNVVASNSYEQSFYPMSPPGFSAASSSSSSSSPPAAGYKVQLLYLREL